MANNTSYLFARSFTATKKTVKKNTLPITILMELTQTKQ